MTKKIKIFINVILYSGIISLNSCVSGDISFDDSLPLNPVLVPIKAIFAEDGANIVGAKINNSDRTIHLDLMKSSPQDLKALNMTIHISKRAKLISPTDTILTLDLTTPFPIVINNLYKDITYTLTASIQEDFLIDNSVFKEHRLNNDSPASEGNIIYLWDSEFMTAPESYGQIGYRNYLTTECFTFDMGAHYYLYRFRASLYWAYTNVCPKKYQLFGYLEDGEPPISGNWDDWTVLGTINNSESTLADFATGDFLEFSKEDAKKVRYLRVRCLENYRVPPTTYISLCEVTLWAWNL